MKQAKWVLRVWMLATSMPAHAQPSLLRESCLSPISFFSRREATIFLTTHKPVTHKLFHSPRSSFCIVTACAGGHTTTGRPSSFTKWIIIIVIIMICDPYFFLVRRDRENWWHFFGLSKIGSQVSFLVQWLKLKPAARTSEGSLNAIFSFKWCFLSL